MTTAGNTPNFIAESQVLPFRLVEITAGQPFTVRPFSGDRKDAMIGITDGSVRAFNSTVHANAGEPVVLQNSEFVQLTCGATAVISAGDLLQYDTYGSVQPISDLNTGIGRAYFVACENAQYGELFWARRIGAYEVTSVNADLLYSIGPATTTDATPTEIGTSAVLSSALQDRGMLSSRFAMGFSAILIGSNDTGTVSGAYRFDGLVRGPAAGNFSPSNLYPCFLVNSIKTVLGETNAALDASIGISAFDGWPAFTATGLAATTMQWKFTITSTFSGSF